MCGGFLGVTLLSVVSDCFVCVCEVCGGGRGVVCIVCVCEECEGGERLCALCVYVRCVRGERGVVCIVCVCEVCEGGCVCVCELDQLYPWPPTHASGDKATHIIMMNTFALYLAA